MTHNVHVLRGSITRDPDPAQWPNLFACLAHEMFEIRRALEMLSVELVTNESTMEAHLESLQEFDVLIQRADESGRIIGRLASGLTLDDAVGQVRLGKFQQRLIDALAADNIG